MPTFGVYPAYDVLTAGDEVSSTYEGRHVTLLESELIHKAGNVGGFVNKGDAVVFGTVALQGVGVAFKTAVAATDLIAIDTEGIWALPVVASNDNGASAVVGGDPLFINTTTAVISKIKTAATQIPFGYALGAIAAGTHVIAVKVHYDQKFVPQIGTISQTFARADMTDNAGTATGYIDLTTQLPAGAIPTGWKLLTNLGFTGDPATAVVSVGIAGDLDRFSADTTGSVYVTGVTVGSEPLAADACKSINAAVAIRVTITSAADFTNVAAGNATITFYYI
jgi:hypothetical protein